MSRILSISPYVFLAGMFSIKIAFDPGSVLLAEGIYQRARYADVNLKVSVMLLYLPTESFTRRQSLYRHHTLILRQSGKEFGMGFGVGYGGKIYFGRNLLAIVVESTARPGLGLDLGQRYTHGETDDELSQCQGLGSI